MECLQQSRIDNIKIIAANNRQGRLKEDQKTWNKLDDTFNIVQFKFEKELTKLGAVLIFFI